MISVFWDSGVATRFAFCTSLYFAALFSNLGVYLPFMPVFLAWRGMTAFEIAILTSAPLFVRIVATPAIGIWSDAQDDHRRAIILGGWAAIVCAAILPFANGFWLILLLVVVLQLATQSLIPLMEAKSLSGAQRLGVDYGRMRLWGSLAFIGANMAGGSMIAAFGGESIAIMIFLTVSVTAAAAYALPADDSVKILPPQDFKEGFARAFSLLSHRWFVFLVLAAGLIQGSHAVFYVFSALYWRSIGISDAWIGMLWALGVIAEVGFFIVSNRVLIRFGAVGLLIIGGCAAVLRWLAMAFEPAFWLLFPLQCLHALTFAATHLGTVNLIQTYVPVERCGAAQSVNSAIGSGIFMGLSTLLAGALYEPFGTQSYIAMSLLAFLGLIAAMCIRVRYANDNAQ